MTRHFARDLFTSLILRFLILTIEILLNRLIKDSNWVFNGLFDDGLLLFGGVEWELGKIFFFDKYHLAIFGTLTVHFNFILILAFNLFLNLKWLSLLLLFGHYIRKLNLFLLWIASNVDFGIKHNVVNKTLLDKKPLEFSEFLCHFLELGPFHRWAGCNVQHNNRVLVFRSDGLSRLLLTKEGPSNRCKTCTSFSNVKLLNDFCELLIKCCMRS